MQLGRYQRWPVAEQETTETQEILPEPQETLLYFTLWVTEHWHREAPSLVVDSPPPEIFKSSLDTVLDNLLQVVLLEQQLGPDDIQRFLATSVTLWFCGLCESWSQSCMLLLDIAMEDTAVSLEYILEGRGITTKK